MLLTQIKIGNLRLTSTDYFYSYMCYNFCIDTTLDVEDQSIFSDSKMLSGTKLNNIVLKPIHFFPPLSLLRIQIVFNRLLKRLSANRPFIFFG